MMAKPSLEVAVMTEREEQMMILMSEQVEAKDAGAVKRYQELQSAIEALAAKMGWPVDLVREGPVGVVGS